LRDGDHFKDPDVEWRIILKWIFDKWNTKHELDRSGSEKGQEVSCKCDNKPSGSIKYWKVLDQLRTC
jgi:hypothetical protein